MASPDAPVESAADVRIVLTGWRKFILALLASLGSFTLCLLGHLSSGDYFLVQSAILGIHGASNVFDKKFGGAG